jgi:hypothetical protein
MQVPLHLGQIVASATDPLSPRAYAATSAVSVLLKLAMADEILVTNLTYTAGSLVANCTHTAGSLASSMGRQLQQSGFMAALPQLLDAAAAALKEVQHEPGLAHVPQHSSFVFAGSSVGPGRAASIMPSSRSSDTHFADSVSLVMHTQAVVGVLLEVLNSCTGCWPHLLDTAAVFLPSLHLCATTMQHCSRCADVTSPVAPAPTALESLMYAACSVVQSACFSRQLHCSSCWRQEDPAALASSAGHPAALQALSMVLLAFTLCPQGFELSDDAVTADRTASSTASSTASRVTFSNLRNINASQSAWQFACSHQSELSQLQQQVLQELGCGSGRALMFAAQHKLSFVNNTGDFRLVTDAYLRLAQHGRPLLQLDQPQDLQQLAEALAQHKDGDSPPCGSRLLPCAALLWLVPAVMLEWLQKQPADWLCRDMCYILLGRLTWLSLSKVQHQWQFWDCAHKKLCGSAGQEEQEGQHANAASSMQTAASRVAMGLSKYCEPPAPLLVQLLHQTTGAAAHFSARMQDAVRVTTTESSSSNNSGNGSSCGARSCSRAEGSHASVGSSHDDGDIQQAPTDTGLGKTLLMLFMVQHSLCELIDCNLYVSSHNAAASRLASSSFSGEDTSLRPEQQASLTSLCAALQETLPQLASLSEVVLRNGCYNRLVVSTLHYGGSYMQRLSDPGLFIAASMQPGSSAAKALCSLSFTLLKLADATIHAKPPVNEKATNQAAKCLWSVVLFTVVFVTAACTGGDADSLLETSDRADEAIRMLYMADIQDSSIVMVSNPWGAGPLSLISSAASAASAASTSTSSSSSSSGGDAVALVPWLVSLGRCYMSYAFFLQTGGTILPQDAARASLMGPLRDVAAALHVWLHSSSVSAQLSAAGYNTQRVLELLQSALQAGQDALQAGVAVVLTPELLQQLGLALSNLPIGTACNNPRCSSLDGLSEQQLVVGKARLCAGCRVARYCCRACQVAAWKQHKPACKAVARTSAALCAEHPA